MAKKPKSVRLSPVDHDFINRSDFNFSLEINQFVHRKRRNQSIGRCAACGTVVYEGGDHTLVENSTPLHDIFDLGSTTVDFELCNSCLSQAQTTLSETDQDNPTPRYLIETGPVIYDAERRALRDGESNDFWMGLLEDPDPELAIEMILEWAKQPESDVDPNELAEEVQKETDLDVSELH